MEFLTREAIRDRITITKNASYADILESDDEGGEKLKEGLDPLLAASIQEIEFSGDRITSIKLFGKARHRLATASSGKN